MMRYLFVIVICIFIYECYWPIPDTDRDKFEYYVGKVVTDKKIPKEELIYFGIKLKVYRKHRPQLNYGEKKIINKFKGWLNEK